MTTLRLKEEYRKLHVSVHQSWLILNSSHVISQHLMLQRAVIKGKRPEVRYPQHENNRAYRSPFLRPRALYLIHVHPLGREPHSSSKACDPPRHLQMKATTNYPHPHTKNQNPTIPPSAPLPLPYHLITPHPHPISHHPSQKSPTNPSISISIPPLPLPQPSDSYLYPHLHLHLHLSPKPNPPVQDF